MTGNLVFLQEITDRQTYDEDVDLTSFQPGGDIEEVCGQGVWQG